MVIHRATTNLIKVFGATPANVNNLNLDSTATLTADGSYHNILISWDIENDDNHLYIDDVSGITVNVSDNTDIDYSVANYAIGAHVDGTQKSNCDINVMYFNPAEKMDFSVEANRRKFFDVNGNWVPSRLDGGQEPTGNRPAIYMCATYRAFQGNHGSGGGFAVTGALTEPA